MAGRPEPPAGTAPVPRLLQADRGFYLAIALAVALVVVLGFGPGLHERLLRPPSPRPPVLYLHAALFTAWVLLFLVQATLVRSRRIAWHRRLGLLGFVLGGMMPAVGVATALAMTRLRLAEGVDKAPFLIISFFDMLAFAITFGLAALWRRRPEYHRRLMLMAACGLTVAAFARFPGWLMPDNAFYAGVDVLILVAACRDWVLTRRLHPVYRYGFPALVLGQAVAMWIYLSRWPAWVAIAHALLR